MSCDKLIIIIGKTTEIILQFSQGMCLILNNLMFWNTCLFSAKKGHILKNKEKNKCVCINEIMRFIIMKMKMKTKKRLHGYDYCLRYTLIQLYHASNFTRDNEMSRVNTFLSNTFISNARLKFAKYQAHHREAKLFLYESLLNLACLRSRAQLATNKKQKSFWLPQQQLAGNLVLVFNLFLICN